MTICSNKDVTINKLHTALMTISKFDKVSWLRNNSEKFYGLPYEEALEYAYENAIQQAKLAIKGIKLPKKEIVI